MQKNMQRIKAGNEKEAGFTLMELIFSAALAIGFLLVIGVLFQKGNNLSDVLSAEAQIQRNGRKIVHFISSTLRQARHGNGNGNVTIPLPPNNNSITFDLPIYQQSPNVCSAFASVAEGTSPVVCTSNGQADCDSGCGVATAFCNNGVCRRTYTYAVSASGNLFQIILSSGSETSRVIGNQVGTVFFQDNTMDLNLQANEIRITLATAGDVISEKRSHQVTLNSVVQVRN